MAVLPRRWAGLRITTLTSGGAGTRHSGESADHTHTHTRIFTFVMRAILTCHWSFCPDHNSALSAAADFVQQQLSDDELKVVESLWVIFALFIEILNGTNCPDSKPVGTEIICDF